MIFGIPETFDVEDDHHEVSLINSSPEIPSLMKLEDFSDLNDEFTSQLNYLTEKFNTTLEVQNNNVSQIVKEERERIRKQQELEQKQKEEERKKKEEAEKQRKLKEEQEKQKQIKEEQERQQKLKEQQEKEKKEQLKKKQEEEERNKLKAEAEKKAEEKRKSSQKFVTSTKSIEDDFFKYKKDIETIKTLIMTPVTENKELKKQIGVVRRKINPKFGQLSNSMNQLQKITNELIELVDSLKNYELPYKFILNFISKAVLSQAETEVVVQNNAAVPLARLTSHLLDRYPELNYYIMARFVKKCPLLIGYNCSIDSEEGRQRMGWKRNESSGKWEEPDKYDERLSGICSVWSVLTTLNNQYYPISMSWTYLARTANQPLHLLQNVHFFCLANWWEAAGKVFLMTYKGQAFKLLSLIAMDLPNKVDKKYPAATRLKILGEEGISMNMKSLREMER